MPSIWVCFLLIAIMFHVFDRNITEVRLCPSKSGRHILKFPFLCGRQNAAQHFPRVYGASSQCPGLWEELGFLEELALKISSEEQEKVILEGRNSGGKKQFTCLEATTCAVLRAHWPWCGLCGSCAHPTLTSWLCSRPVPLTWYHLPASYHLLFPGKFPLRLQSPGRTSLLVKSPGLSPVSLASKPALSL